MCMVGWIIIAPPPCRIDRWLDLDQLIQFYMVVVLLLFIIHVSSLFSICFIQVSQLLNYKDHDLFTPVFCLDHVLFLPTYLYIFSLYTWCIPLYFLSSFPQYSVAKSREGVVRGIPVCTYERTVHTFIPYIALNSLIERPRSIVREIYGSPHIPF